jgi:hypothetical protein
MRMATERGTMSLRGIRPATQERREAERSHAERGNEEGYIGLSPHATGARPLDARTSLMVRTPNLRSDCSCCKRYC